MLEKAGIILRSVSPWLNPIIIVLKKAQQEQPQKHLCVDYQTLNSLLLPVVKAHSKVQGVPSLVLLPEIDELMPY